MQVVHVKYLHSSFSRKQKIYDFQNETKIHVFRFIQNFFSFSLLGSFFFLVSLMWAYRPDGPDVHEIYGMFEYYTCFYNRLCRCHQINKLLTNLPIICIENCLWLINCFVGSNPHPHPRPSLLLMSNISKFIHLILHVTLSSDVIITICRRKTQNVNSYTSGFRCMKVSYL